MGKHKVLQEQIGNYAEWYVDYLLSNGYHPSRYERTEFAGRNSKTLTAWENEIVGLGWAKRINRGTLGTILLFPGVYFVDKRKKDGE